MQTLGVVARLFPAILSGEKTSTIRWREPRIAPGFMRYVCDEEPDRTTVVWVTRVTSMPLSEAAAFVGREADWPEAIMLAGMREHYPQIGWSDTVEVIEHLTPAETRLRPDCPR
jgi:hypothetical protein